MIECIAFKLNAFDTHAAYDKQTSCYTIVADGNYVVRDNGGWRKLTLRNGDTFTDAKEVISQSCGKYYTRALNQINKCRE